MRHPARGTRNMDSAFQDAQKLADPLYRWPADRDFHRGWFFAALLARRIAPVAPQDSPVLARKRSNRTLAGADCARRAEKLRLGRRDRRLPAAAQGLRGDA